MSDPVQTTLELGVPLAEVTFCVVDLETTGGSPVADAITEIGAVKFRGGERLGTFQTLVNPRAPDPAVDRAPHRHRRPARRGGAAASSRCCRRSSSSSRGSVFVAHNAGFDFGVPQRALRRARLPGAAGAAASAPPGSRAGWCGPTCPTCGCTRSRSYFRTRVKPDPPGARRRRGLRRGPARAARPRRPARHRDARRPHRGGARAAAGPTSARSALADDLPHAPGVYLFRGRDGRVLYVGKSKDLRARVKSYFYGDERKKIVHLLDEVRSVEGIGCDGELEALVVEARLIRRHEPKYNRRGKTWRRYAYLKLDPREALPRLKVVREAKPGDGRIYLGPFGSSARARLAKEALEEVVPDPPVHHRDGRSPRGSHRAPSPTWAAASHPATAASTPNATESSSDGSPPPCFQPGRAPRSARTPHGPPRRRRALRGSRSVRDRLRALAEALWRSRTDAWLVEPAGSNCEPATPAAIGDALAVRPWSAAHAGSRRRTAHLAVPARSRRRARGRPFVDRRASARALEACDVAPAEPVEGGAELARVLSRGARARRASAPPSRAVATTAVRLQDMERAVILEGARTPIGRFLGSFADTPAVELGELAAAEALRRAGVEAAAGRADDLRPRTPGRATGRTPDARSASGPACRRRSAPTTSTSRAARA